MYSPRWSTAKYMVLALGSFRRHSALSTVGRVRFFFFIILNILPRLTNGKNSRTSWGNKGVAVLFVVDLKLIDLQPLSSTGGGGKTAANSVCNLFWRSKGLFIQNFPGWSLDVLQVYSKPVKYSLQKFARYPTPIVRHPNFLHANCCCCFFFLPSFAQAIFTVIDLWCGLTLFFPPLVTQLVLPEWLFPTFPSL